MRVIEVVTGGTHVKEVFVEAQTEFGIFRDTVYIPAAEYGRMTASQKAARRKQRVDDHVARLRARIAAEPTEPPPGWNPKTGQVDPPDEETV